MKRSFNRFRTTKNTEVIVFEKRWICWNFWFK